MNTYKEEWLYKALYIFFGYSFTLYFVEINRENVIFCAHVCDGAK